MHFSVLLATFWMTKNGSRIPAGAEIVVFPKASRPNLESTLPPVKFMGEGGWRFSRQRTLYLELTTHPLLVPALRILTAMPPVIAALCLKLNILPYKLRLRMRNSDPFVAVCNIWSEFGMSEWQFAERKEVPDANCYSCDSVPSL
jgi:hypothetical protein